ncbi:hypothetical protein RCL1_008902 [Eukaryota sp. TZLM3-RCL]
MLTIELLSQFTEAVQSPLDHIRKPADDALTSFITVPGTLSIVLEFISNPRFTLNQRTIACSFAKLIVSREWRGTGGSVTTTDKDLAKTLVTTLFNEPDVTLCSSIADLYGKMIRKQTLRLWPDVPSILLHMSNDKLRTGVDCRCCLLALLSLLEELSTMCLASDRKLFHSLSASLCPLLTSISSSLIRLSDFSSPSSLHNPLLLSLKSLNVLILKGLVSATETEVPTLLSNIASMSIEFITLINLEKGKLSSEVAQQFMVILLSIYTVNFKILEENLNSLIIFLFPLVAKFPEIDVSLFSSMLDFLSNILTSRQRLTQPIKDAITTLFSTDSIKFITHHLTYSCLSSFHDAELISLIDIDPEEFHVKSTTDYSLSSASARSFIACLFTEISNILKEILFNLLNNELPSLLTSQESNFDTLKKIDGILELLCISSSSFFGKEARQLIPALTSLLSLSKHNHPIIRRRICLVVSSFAFLFAPNPDSVNVIMSLFLDSSAIVKYSAWDALHEILSEGEAVRNARDLIENTAQGLITHLIEATKELTSDDMMKLSCLILSDICSIMQTSIKPFIPIIINGIPVFWNRKAVRSDLLSLLKRLVYLIGEESVLLWSTVIPLLEPIFGSKILDSAVIHDSICLYLGLIRNTSAVVQNLTPIFQLFQFIPHLLSTEIYLLPFFMQIVFSATLLGGASFCQSFAKILAKILKETTSTVTDKGLVLVSSVYDLVFLHASSHIASLIPDTVIDVMSVVVSAGSGDIEDFTPLLIASYSALCCRILHSNAPLFFQILSKVEQENAFLYFVSGTMAFFDVLSDSHKQKIVLSALFFSLEQDTTGIVLQQLPTLVGCFALYLEQESRLPGSSHHCSLSFDNDLYDEEEIGTTVELPERARVQSLQHIDPVIQINLKEIFGKSLSAACRRFPDQFTVVQGRINPKEWEIVNK